jgi:prepilin-type N-terminal cleavage/methylation domain-containing protein
MTRPRQDTSMLQRSADGMGAPRELRRASRRPGFTLVELIVVIGIIVLVVALVIPGVATMWSQRKQSSTQNLIQGMLMSTRPKALQPDGAERGLLFIVDGQGVQRAFPLEQGVPDWYAAGGPGQALDPLATQDWFFIPDDAAEYVLLAPMRVVPRYAVEVDEAGNQEDDTTRFDALELANDDFPECPACPQGADEAQRNRNFFSLVFSRQGELEVWRSVVLIEQDLDGNRLGDRTGLTLTADPSTSVTHTFNLKGNSEQIDKMKSRALAVPNAVVDRTSNTAINFYSVDGLVLYDDATFRDVETPEQKRSLLIEQGLPYYVSRLTGAVIQGPRGENEVEN